MPNITKRALEFKIKEEKKKVRICATCTTYHLCDAALNMHKINEPNLIFLVPSGTSSLKEKPELKHYYKLFFSTHNGLSLKIPKWQQK